MKFGLFGGARTAAGVADGYRVGYGNYIDNVVEAERLGFYSNFIVEHHFSGSGQVSASMNILSYIAAKTSKIRLGTAVVVLPWHNPVLVAEQAATLDLLSNGRFDFGVGRGYRFSEFDGFCIPIEEAEERFEEAMTVVRKAWTTDGPFSHEGKRWKYNNIVVEPDPVQKPHPPLWQAAGRPESLRYAAANNYNLLLDQFQTFDVVFERIEIYRKALKDAGRIYDPLGIAVARGLLIAETPSERDAAIEARMQAIARINQFGKSADGSQKSSMVSDDDLMKATVEGTLLGSPAEIIERLHVMAEEGIGYVILSSRSQDDLRTFAEKIAPAFG